MNDMNPTIPTQADLIALKGMQLVVKGSANMDVAITLTSVDKGIPMSASYLCYSAIFQLPPNMTAAQGTYRLFYAEDKYWDLFLTPIHKNNQGISQLEAVFHVNA